MADKSAGKRTRRMSVSVSESAYAKIQAAAEDVGMSVNGWAAFTLGSAAASQATMRAKMSDGMVALLQKAIEEGALEDAPE